MTELHARDLMALADRLTPEERAVRAAAFTLILGGEPTDSAEVLAAAGLHAEESRGVVERLVERGTLAREGDRIVGAYGLSLRPARHRLILYDRPFAAWCAFDTIGIPAALEQDALVESACVHCGAPIVVTIRGGVPLGGEAIRLWFADADFERPLSAT
ncbi:MAG: hypothetical protein HY331_06175 [Chloroflexi bacterium]|nr:hypothetical protein [Chloroflexota bacterium]